MFLMKGTNPPEYFQSEKYYTIGPGIDFPMIMEYKDTENPNFEPYFYFLNGHGDVTYFADTNFTEVGIESYEYNPWGVLLTSANKNNLLYTSREFDFETGLQFNRMRYYNTFVGRFNIRDRIFSKNYYNYVKNIPIRFLDPCGLFGDMIIGKCVDDSEQIKICLQACEDTKENDLDVCDIRYDSAMENCRRGYKQKTNLCQGGEAGFNFQNLLCYIAATKWFEDCINLTNSERAACYDEAYAVYESCLYSCFGLIY